MNFDNFVEEDNSVITNKRTVNINDSFTLSSTTSYFASSHVCIKHDLC